jgi:beta-lactamase superfamily II metal-dependent hydrolase
MARSKLFLVILVLSSVTFSQTKELPKWEKGFLDIHFISTGRGNSAFYILPDGTTMLVDAGDLTPGDSLRRTPAIPNNSKTSAQWIAEYIYQFHPDSKNAKLDYAIVTHYHDDHFGHFNNSVKTYPEGNYKLSGITELGSIIPIRLLIDRGYDYPIDFKSEEFQNRLKANPQFLGAFNQFNEYWKFIAYQEKTNGLEYQRIKVGATDQIKLKNHPEEYPESQIKNLFANGNIANNWDENIAIHKFKKGEMADENDLSIGLKITYGKFDLYTGADITGNDDLGEGDFNSMESLAAPVIGPVDVATLNHHGNKSSVNQFFVRTIRPHVWIGQSWSANHPGDDVLSRLTSKILYPGDRDLFTNFLHQSNKTVIGRRAGSSYKSTEGHIVVRVYPKGELYDVFVLDDKAEERKVIAQYHYQSR